MGLRLRRTIEDQNENENEECHLSFPAPLPRVHHTPTVGGRLGSLDRSARSAPSRRRDATMPCHGATTPRRTATSQPRAAHRSAIATKVESAVENESRWRGKSASMTINGSSELSQWPAPSGRPRPHARPPAPCPTTRALMCQTRASHHRDQERIPEWCRRTSEARLHDSSTRSDLRRRSCRPRRTAASSFPPSSLSADSLVLRRRAERARLQSARNHGCLGGRRELPESRTSLAPSSTCPSEHASVDDAH